MHFLRAEESTYLATKHYKRVEHCVYTNEVKNEISSPRGYVVKFKRISRKNSTVAQNYQIRCYAGTSIQNRLDFMKISDRIFEERHPIQVITKVNGAKKSLASEIMLKF